MPVARGLYYFVRSHIQTKVCENSRAGKTLDCISGFHWFVLKFSQTFTSVSPGYEGTENMLYFFYRIIFYLNKEKDDIWNEYVYFNFSDETKTVNSHNLETANHIAHVIFVLHSVMKTHL